MAYVYRHIRLDKNEPFYIGIGSDIKYHRAGEKTRRNNIWKKIVDKTEYEIEILIDGITYEQAKKKEIEFIQLYGRIIDGSGILSNLTTGGEGAKGHIVTQETIDKIRNAQIGRKFTKEHIDKIRIARIGCKMPKRTKEHQEKLANALKGKPRNEQTKLKLSLANMGKISKRRKKIMQYDKNGNFIQEYDCIKDASIKYNVTHSSIVKALQKENATCCNYLWKYKNNI